VLSGGGARSAYQVGVLRQLGRMRPDLAIDVLTGVSAGAINAAFVAQARGSFGEASERLAGLWLGIGIEDVIRPDSPTMARIALRWGLRLVSGGRATVQPTRGLVDTEPLGNTLSRALTIDDGGALVGVEENIRDGRMTALAITGTNYATGRSVTWVQGADIEHWERADRLSVHARIAVPHILASSALPLLFPAVQVDGEWYGDGGIRLTAPLSPAVHLGAERLLVISTRYRRTRSDFAEPPMRAYPSPAQIAGNLLNAVFLDLLDQDAMNLARINTLIQQLPGPSSFREVALHVVRPSADLGRLANDYEAKLPRPLRFMTRGLGTKEARSNDLLSLIMFQNDYLTRLVDLGERDAQADSKALLDFVDGRVG
jgi:NTE family protein